MPDGKRHYSHFAVTERKPLCTNVLGWCGKAFTCVPRCLCTRSGPHEGIADADHLPLGDGGEEVRRGARVIGSQVTNMAIASGFGTEGIWLQRYIWPQRWTA